MCYRGHYQFNREQNLSRIDKALSGARLLPLQVRKEAKHDTGGGDDDSCDGNGQDGKIAVYKTVHLVIWFTL